MCKMMARAIAVDASWTIPISLLKSRLENLDLVLLLLTERLLLLIKEPPLD